MSDQGAYPSEMGGRLTESQIERLLSGWVLTDAEHERLATFVRAAAATLRHAPDPAHEAALVPRLAATAAANVGSGAARAPAGPRVRSRRSLALRLGLAVGLLPAALAGLAVAGVTLPEPAQDAFERVGIELPNQVGNAEADEARESDGQPGKGKGSPGKPSGQGNGPSPNRQANGPSGSARPNPPGKAVRRGPNPSPGTPRGEPVEPAQPFPPGDNPGGAGGSGNGQALGHTRGNGSN